MKTDILNQEFVLDFDYNGTHYSGYAKPLPPTCKDEVCFENEIHLNDKNYGMLYRERNQWYLEGENDQEFINTIGELVTLSYE